MKINGPVYKSPVSRSIPFDNTTNGFDSDISQDAIEEIDFRSFTYEPTGFVDRTSSTFNFNDATRTFSIYPTSGSFTFFIRGHKYVKTSLDTVQITDTEGLWFIYYSGENLIASQSSWFFNDPVAFVAVLYWDSTNKKAILTGEERHGITMDWATHKYLHFIEGAKILPNTLLIGNYIINGNGSSNSHATYSISNGTVFDEDIDANVRHSATPTSFFEQVLTPIAKMPVFYRIGSSNWWRRKEPTDYPVYENPGTTASYNLDTNGSWSLANVTNNWYFATWLVYTTDIRYPVFSILGQRQDPNLVDAVNNNTRASLILDGLPQQEKYFYRKLIWQTSTSYTNTPKVRLVYVSTTVEITPSNDRYAIIASYNGNAGVGKYLEFFPGQSSDVNPFPIPDISFLRTITLSASANSTGTVGIFKSTDLVNPIISISLSNSKYNKIITTLLINADEFLACKVTSGSINKPNIVIFIQTNV